LRLRQSTRPVEGAQQQGDLLHCAPEAAGSSQQTCGDKSQHGPNPGQSRNGRAKIAAISPASPTYKCSRRWPMGAVQLARAERRATVQNITLDGMQEFVEFRDAFAVPGIDYARGAKR